jgi:hypothetical protein
MFGAFRACPGRLGALTTPGGGSMPSAPFCHLEGAGNGVVMRANHAPTISTQAPCRSAMRRGARCSSIRFSGGPGAGGARCAGLGRRDCSPSSSASRRGQPQGDWSRRVCSATDAAIEPRSWRRAPSGLGSCPGTRSFRRSTSVLTSSVICSAAPFAPGIVQRAGGMGRFWTALYVGDADRRLLSWAGLLLPRAIRERGPAKDHAPRFLL